MGRSKWRGPFVDFQYFSNIKEVKEQLNKNTAIKITRNSEILPAFLGLTFNVHNGKSYSEINITDGMIGHKFGEFSFTRSRFIYKKKKQKK